MIGKKNLKIIVSGDDGEISTSLQNSLGVKVYPLPKGGKAYEGSFVLFDSKWCIKNNHYKHRGSVILNDKDGENKQLFDFLWKDCCSLENSPIT